MEASPTNLKYLVTAANFAREVGIARGDLQFYIDEGRAYGLIYIDGKCFIDRQNVEINYYQNGYKFGLWKELGGRHGPVNVPEFIKTRNKQTIGTKVVNGGELSPPGSNG